MGWPNDKTSANQNATTNRDLLIQVIKEHNLDILGVSEANVLKETDQARVKIKGFQLVCDKLLATHGRARSMVYSLLLRGGAPPADTHIA